MPISKFCTSIWNLQLRRGFAWCSVKRIARKGVGLVARSGAVGSCELSQKLERESARGLLALTALALDGVETPARSRNFLHRQAIRGFTMC